MELILALAFGLIFTSIAFFRFHQATALFLFLLPVYLIRFSIGPLPTTLLEIMFIGLILVWIFLEGPRIPYYLARMIKKEQWLFGSIVLFLLAATLSLFYAVDLQTALGAWKAFYIEPVILFLLLSTSIKTKQELHLVLSGLIFGGLVTSLLAVYQQFTGWMVPSAFWDNNGSYRVTGWYGFPNGVGLFLAPLIPLAGYLIQERLTQLSQRNKEQRDVIFLGLCLTFLVTAPLAIIFAKSTGALVGIGVGIGFLLLLNKGTRIPTLVIGIIGLISLFSINALAPLQEELTFQDRSGQIRLSIWKETAELLKDHPIRGAGLASYDTIIEPYHTTVNGEGIEIFHHPHNIFLTIWVNLGLLGLLSFMLLLLWFFRKSPGNSILITTAMVVLLVHGLVDSPYIKNDLAMLFWVLPALLFLIDSTKSQMEL